MLVFTSQLDDNAKTMTYFGFAKRLSDGDSAAGVPSTARTTEAGRKDPARQRSLQSAENPPQPAKTVAGGVFSGHIITYAN